MKLNRTTFLSGLAVVVGLTILPIPGKTEEKFTFILDDNITPQFNALGHIRLNTKYDIQDAKNLALMITDPDGSKTNYDNWHFYTKSALTALILDFSYSKNINKKDKKLINFKKYVNNLRNNTNQKFQMIMEKSTHPYVKTITQDILNSPQNEKECVLAMINNYISDIV